MAATRLETPAPTQFDAPPVVAPGHTLMSVTDKITGVVLTRRTPRVWFAITLVAFLMFSLGGFAITWLFIYGVGLWGINVPVAWAFAIINFVWWIGIGHAGTLISAILLLLRQQWRTSINRFAEAMTLFAVAQAGQYPILHLGRPYLFYWLIPYPNTMAVWPGFRSPLVWDVFAITTYGTVSLLFWYTGLIPDLATMRDRAKNRVVRTLYGIFALGWRFSARHWRRYDQAYYLLAALSTPLVVSVHTVVSFDFAYAMVPGWHTTIFPPYFVAGAIFDGFAMVLTLAIPIRAIFKLHDFITDRHIRNMAKVMLVAGLVVAYGYAMEHFMAWYSGNQYESFTFFNTREQGPYNLFYWAMILCNVVIPQLIWIRPIRNNVIAIWLISNVINVGMWLERFVIIVTSLARDFLTSSWGMYSPTFFDIATFAGTIGLFVTLMFIFVRLLPAISMSEMRELVIKTEGEGHGHHPVSQPADLRASGRV